MDLALNLKKSPIEPSKYVECSLGQASLGLSPSSAKTPYVASDKSLASLSLNFPIRKVRLIAEPTPKGYADYKMIVCKKVLSTK